jgi:hypothetical protein
MMKFARIAVMVALAGAAVSGAAVFGIPNLAKAQNNQGGNNQDGNSQGGYTRGAPGPVAGAGLPILAVGYGVYWLIKRRRKPE